MLVKGYAKFLNREKVPDIVGLFVQSGIELRL